MKRLVLSFMSVAILVGCTTSNKEKKYAEMPEYVKAQPAVHIQETSNEGSLWSNDGNLVGDIKAYNEGDILTIIVSEVASSSNKSSTKLSEDSSTQSGLTNMVGLQSGIFRAIGAAAGGAGSLLNIGGSNSYKGSGENSKDDKLQATITARVVKVLPRHRLFIRGEKQIYTNGEEQTLILTGIIDRYRIANDNTVNSEYISDAKIFYNGKGLVSDTRNKGWLAKLWEIIRPF
jgi:flagellar L-ring protein precursor FlgH